jgi:hypothetical protein
VPKLRFQQHADNFNHLATALCFQFQRSAQSSRRGDDVPLTRRLTAGRGELKMENGKFEMKYKTNC